jgi:uncharacterized membrane protein YbhN (UPF0104 family)
MTGFIAHLYNLLVHFTNHYMTHYVFLLIIFYCCLKRLPPFWFFSQRVWVRVTLRLALFANQFVLASSPLRLTTRDYFQLSSWGNSVYVTSSAAWDPHYITSGQTHRKHRLSAIVPSLGVVAETCILSSCQAMYVSSGSTIPAFRRHVTILRNIFTSKEETELQALEEIQDC